MGFHDVLVHSFDLDIFVFDGMVLFSIKILGNPEPLFEVLLNIPCPISKSECILSKLHCIVAIFSFFMQFLIGIEIVFKQSHKFNWCSVPRGRRAPFSLGLLRRPHLIHPRETIMYIPSQYKPSTDIRLQTNIKPLILHIRIDLYPRIPLPKIDPLHRRLEYLLDNLLQLPHNLPTLSLKFLVFEFLLIQKHHRNLFLEDVVVAGVVSVVLDGSDEPPSGVAGVVTGVLAAVQEVGEDGVAQG